MKVLIVNTSDSKGGAAIVAHRLLQALNANGGVEATMLVAEKRTADPHVVALPKSWWLKKALDRFVVWVANGFRRKGLWLVDGGFFGSDITRRPEFQEADVIHLHWVNQGFLGLKDMERVLRSGKKVVWTMHDAWLAEELYHHARVAAPGGLLWPWLKRWVVNRKRRMLQDVPLHLIPCSTWMQEVAHHSPLTAHLPATVIPNVYDSPVLHEPLSRRTEGRKRILFVAARLDDEVKGLDDLIAALRTFQKEQDVELLLVGGVGDERVLKDISIPYRYLGYQREMKDVYEQATCLVSCSRCETLPTTIVEAQAHGVTPVAYDHSGAKDLMEEGLTGYFAKYRDVKDLARVLDYALHHPLAVEELREHVRQTYNAEEIARRHLEIYYQ